MVVGLAIVYLGVLLLLAQVANFLLPAAGDEQANQAQTEEREAPRR